MSDGNQHQYCQAELSEAPRRSSHGSYDKSAGVKKPFFSRVQV
jgi:hypothetical protein